MSDKLWPIVVWSSRYGGIYERGQWCALYAEIIPCDAMGSDTECAVFFEEHDPYIGRGNTPNEAVEDLRIRYERTKVWKPPYSWGRQDDDRVLTMEYLRERLDEAKHIGIEPTLWVFTHASFAEIARIPEVATARGAAGWGGDDALRSIFYGIEVLIAPTTQSYVARLDDGTVVAEWEEEFPYPGVKGYLLGRVAARFFRAGNVRRAMELAHRTESALVPEHIALRWRAAS